MPNVKITVYCSSCDHTYSRKLPVDEAIYFLQDLEEDYRCEDCTGDEPDDFDCEEEE